MAEEKNEEVEETLDLPQTVEGVEDTTDWKAEAIKLREKAIAQRERTKTLKQKLAEKEAEAKKITKTLEKKTTELDYGAKAYLKASGIDSSEFDFVKEQIESSGKDLDTLLNNPYFQVELKNLREAKAVAKATPAAGRTVTEPANSKVDYWIAKGELPPDPQLRRDVVNEKIRLEKSSNSK